MIAEPLSPKLGKSWEIAKDLLASASLIRSRLSWTSGLCASAWSTAERKDRFKEVSAAKAELPLRKDNKISKSVISSTYPKLVSVSN